MVKRHSETGTDPVPAGFFENFFRFIHDIWSIYIGETEGSTLRISSKGRPIQSPATVVTHRISCKRILSRQNNLWDACNFATPGLYTWVSQTETTTEASPWDKNCILKRSCQTYQQRQHLLLQYQDDFRASLKSLRWAAPVLYLNGEPRFGYLHGFPTWKRCAVRV